MWYINTIEYYSAIKNNNNNSKCVELGKIILSEVSQTQKTNIDCIHLDLDISC